MQNTLHETYVQEVLRRITVEYASTRTVSADGDALAVCAYIQIRHARRARRERLTFAIWTALVVGCLAATLSAWLLMLAAG